MASFAGADFERIWSHISRLSATSSAPAGMSSEVALSAGCQCSTSATKKTVLTDGLVDLGRSPKPAGQRCHPALVVVRLDNLFAQPQLCRSTIAPIFTLRQQHRSCADEAGRQM